MRPPIWQLVYVSDALLPTDAMLLDIVRTAETGNARHGLSGLLCYGPQRFVQLVEGERAPLVRLLQNLQRDLRHRVAWTGFRKVSARRISETLPMGYASGRQISGLAAADILGMPGAALTPALTARVADALGEAAARLYPSQIRLTEAA